MSKVIPEIQRREPFKGMPIWSVRITGSWRGAVWDLWACCWRAWQGSSGGSRGCGPWCRKAGSVAASPGTTGPHRPAAPGSALQYRSLPVGKNRSQPIKSPHRGYVDRYLPWLLSPSWTPLWSKTAAVVAISRYRPMLSRFDHQITCQGRGAEAFLGDGPKKAPKPGADQALCTDFNPASSL